MAKTRKPVEEREGDVWLYFYGPTEQLLQRSTALEITRRDERGASEQILKCRGNVIWMECA